MPDYKIIQWDETNYNYKKIKFTEEAYKEKKWAFVTDYARLDIIYNNGGIYLDTDVQVIKSFDELLDNEAFMGIENGNYVNTGLGFGAVKKQRGIKLNKEIYEKMSVYDNNGKIKLINCPKITTEMLLKNGAKINGKIEKVLGITIYPIEYFCPMNYYTGEINITDKCFSIHKYSMSWGDKISKKQIEFERKVVKRIGVKNTKIISRIMFFPIKFINSIKNNGILFSLNEYWRKIKRG